MKTTQHLVLFWRTAEIYSNWHAAKFVDEAGRTFENSEQFMMWGKAMVMGDLVMAEKMLTVSNPKTLKEMGRNVTPYIEKRWLEHRLAVMVHGCYLKFSQNQAMRSQLLATGLRKLVEASPDDTIWGIGLEESDPRCLAEDQWLGLNLLGKALMIVRDLLHTGAPLPDYYKSWLKAG